MFNWTISLSDVFVLLGAGFAILRTMRVQALRDQRIDLLLFGANGQPGLLRDVHDLKREVREPVGAVARLRASVIRIRVALAAKGIEVEE